IAYQDRVYTDGSGDAAGHRTMASMLLGSGLTFAEVQALDDELADLRQAQIALTPPAWPFDPPDPDAVDRGRDRYEASCAGCHGSTCGPPAPSVIVPADEVGTDPIRATAFGDVEAAWIDASWFGQEAPMVSTGGYVAPSLVGVWATAPYLHDGAIPDLAAVLDPSLRPVRWRRTGAEAGDYDPERVGWRYDAVDADTPEPDPARVTTYDTTRPGLSAAGHTYAEGLSDADRADLLAFLITL
ncbi:MAG: hypothetical protein ABMB14_15985, partial [Myxococcota bacterium]